MGTSLTASVRTILKFVTCTSDTLPARSVALYHRVYSPGPVTVTLAVAALTTVQLTLFRLYEIDATPPPPSLAVSRMVAESL